MTQQVLSANRLGDGLVVYLTASGGWSERIAESEIVTTEVDGERLIDVSAGAVAAQDIVDPYLIDVAEIDGIVEPLRYRELIRARGPSVRTDLGKQAELA